MKGPASLSVLAPALRSSRTTVRLERVVRLRRAERVEQDDPIRTKPVTLYVRKRRFSCAMCRRPFTEPVLGVRKGYRTTERYRSRLLWACEHFSDLKSVRRTYHCSPALVYRVLYERLELERRKRVYPWPTKVGIDEHLFKHDLRRFVTMIVDHASSIRQRAGVFEPGSPTSPRCVSSGA